MDKIYLEQHWGWIIRSDWFHVSVDWLFIFHWFEGISNLLWIIPTCNLHNFIIFSLPWLDWSDPWCYWTFGNALVLTQSLLCVKAHQQLRWNIGIKCSFAHPSNFGWWKGKLYGIYKKDLWKKYHLTTMLSMQNSIWKCNKQRCGYADDIVQLWEEMRVPTKKSVSASIISKSDTGGRQQMRLKRMDQSWISSCLSISFQCLLLLMNKDYIKHCL